ncbi:BTAD domain-containing putative transcriptional regulator [Agromyces sp. NPDC058484]|uniref:AfsR/SARP family transcriptional regulator n=1 Tax=Agromyces sp. NPDC058484 TaxID=3346524 RepID=UPI003668D7E9
MVALAAHSRRGGDGMGTVSAGGWELRLFGSWGLARDAEPVDVGLRQQRLIAALALLGPRSRRHLASLLWPESSEVHAAGNLRTCLFEVSHQLPALIRRNAGSVAMSEGVSVDVDALRRLVRGLASNGDASTRADLVDALSGADLLPDWYEDWVVFEQERWTQERLSALDVFAEHSIARGDPDPAIRAAMAAIAIEPLRESAHLRLVEGHLLAGNHVAAAIAYRRLRDDLERELGVEPSSRFAELLAHRSDVPAYARGTEPTPTPLEVAHRGWK